MGVNRGAHMAAMAAGSCFTGLGTMVDDMSHTLGRPVCLEGCGKLEDMSPCLCQVVPQSEGYSTQTDGNAKHSHLPSARPLDDSEDVVCVATQPT